MPQIGRPCIVLVDDDPTFLGLMRDLLEGLEGYDVRSCAEADHAFEFVKAHRPDLLLLDVRMGDRAAGWAVLERLTGDPETRPIPVIVCSAAVDEFRGDEPLLRRAGVEVLPKPFELDALLEKIRAGLAPSRC